jgi:hypothetical protein
MDRSWSDGRLEPDGRTEGVTAFDVMTVIFLVVWLAC